MRYKPRILIAEDRPAAQDELVRGLTSRGFRVAAVPDMQSCLRRIESDVPDLVLIDLVKTSDAIDGLRHIREHFAAHALPVIIIAPSAATNDIVAALDAGANDFVSTPVDLHMLVARMRASLKLKFAVGLWLETERQTVLVDALRETCHQLSQPMTAMTITLDGLTRQPDPQNAADLREQLLDLLKWATEVGAVIHRLQRIGTPKAVPYIERLEMFDSEEG
jgi:DNA-binding response OmpR family regulator